MLVDIASAVGGDLVSDELGLVEACAVLEHGKPRKLVRKDFGRHFLYATVFDDLTSLYALRMPGKQCRAHLRRRCDLAETGMIRKCL